MAARGEKCRSFDAIASSRPVVFPSFLKSYIFRVVTVLQNYIFTYVNTLEGLMFYCSAWEGTVANLAVGMQHKERMSVNLYLQ
jgi:hypothetical protein